MRQYQRAWEALKLHKEVSLKAPANTHDRILRAVRKEKYKDVAFKVECSISGNSYQMNHTRDGDIIAFTLVPYTYYKNL